MLSLSPYHRYDHGYGDCDCDCGCDCRQSRVRVRCRDHRRGRLYLSRLVGLILDGPRPRLRTRAQAQARARAITHRDVSHLHLEPVKKVGSGHRRRTSYLGRGDSVPCGGLDACGNGLGRVWSSLIHRRRTRGSLACGRDMCRCGDSLHLCLVRHHLVVHPLLCFHSHPHPAWLVVKARRRRWMAQWCSMMMNAMLISRIVWLEY